jgi:hypothetical protein
LGKAEALAKETGLADDFHALSGIFVISVAKNGRDRAAFISAISVNQWLKIPAWDHGEKIKQIVCSVLKRTAAVGLKANDKRISCLVNRRYRVHRAIRSKNGRRMLRMRKKP